jgi:Phosphate-selective porin O and P
MKLGLLLNLIAFASILSINSLMGQVDNDTLSLTSNVKKLSLEGYGALNYYNFNWQTDTTKRNAIDNERFVLEVGYKWTDKIGLNAEIEFEHGGTGSAVEFDRFEEFGEFEFEVEKGGEVLIEEMNLNFILNKNLTLNVGRLKVPFSLSYDREEPTDYPTATYSEMESQILPDNWTENGIMLDGIIGKNHLWVFHAGIVNGLDGSAFNSANWIKRGNQKRFEMVNAENFAFCGRIDFKPKNNITIGISGYAGNTTDNRPKPDLQVDAFATIGEFHATYHPAFAKMNGMILYGALSNSEALSNQNRNLSNNLNVKRTPVASAAIGGFFEIESSSLINSKNRQSTEKEKPELSIYGRVDYYDTMYRTQGEIFNNPRWERVSYSFGSLMKIIHDVQLKAQYTIRKVGAPAPSSINGGTLEKTFVLGFAFEF